jgi:hypothetical protein
MKMGLSRILNYIPNVSKYTFVLTRPAVINMRAMGLAAVAAFFGPTPSSSHTADR